MGKTFLPLQAYALPALLLLVALSTGSALAQEQATVPEPAVDEASQPSFDVWEFRVDGNTVLEAAEIQAAVYPYLGPAKTIDDVEAARVALERLYRDSGYPTVLVNIPEQQVTAGTVRLEVIEGSVGRLRVSDSDYFSIDDIKEQVPSLAEGRVPYMPAVQEELAALNRASTDRQITPVLRPARTPGEVEVDLKVRDELPLHGNVELNNRQSQDTRPLRLIGSIRYDNLWQRGHSGSLQYQVSPQDPNEVQVLSATYVFKPAGPTSGNVLAVYGVLSDSDVATAGNLTVLGTGAIVGARYINPLPVLGRTFQSFTLGFDYKDFDENVRLEDADGDIQTPISYCNWSLDYKGSSVAPGGRGNYGVSANFGIRDLCNDQAEFELKRFNAQPNYFYLKGFYNYTKPFATRWEFFGALDAQLADAPLVSNEQFIAGGVRSVRGYFESQILGDRGARGSLEIRNRPVQRLPRYLLDLYVLAFLDGAVTEIEDPLPEQEDQFGIAGWGVGVGLVGLKSLTAYLNVAQALEPVGEVEDGDVRVHFGLEFAF